MTRNLGGQTGGFFGGLFKFCQQNHPFIWKFYGNGLDIGAVQVAHDAGCFTIGREVRGDQFDPNEDIAAAVARALRYADLVLSRAVQFGSLISAWEFYNEPTLNISNPDGSPNIPASIRAAQSLNAAQVAFSQRLHAAGYKVVAYNLARGNPYYEVFPYLADGLAASDYGGFHAYGAPFYETDAENQSLRYRRLYASIPSYARKPIIFTEHGTDWNGGGFRLPANNMSVDQFFASMDWWLHQTAQDSYVFGSTAFVVGSDSARWETFEINNDDSLPQFGALVRKDIPVNPVSHSVSASASSSASHSASHSPSASPSHAPEDDMQVYQPFAVPPQFVAHAWTAQAGVPIQDKPFYRLQPAASFLLGVNVYCQVCVIDQFGRPIVGAKVVTIFPDGVNGSVLTTDAKGCATFNGDANWAFTPPALPPMLCFIADDSAYKDNDSIPKRVVYKEKWSDEFRYGDTNGDHTQGNAVMALQVVMPDAVSRDDAIRLRAYPAKALTIPVYCRDCALQAQGRKRSLGAVLSDEFYVTFNSEQYVAQGFALGILATIVGHYADSDFFMVAW